MSNIPPPFYVTLVSDSCLDQYPSNNSAEWTTRLKVSLSLPGKWEVAVVELSYVNSIFNLPTDQQIFVKYFRETTESVQKSLAANRPTLPAAKDTAPADKSKVDRPQATVPPGKAELAVVEKFKQLLTVPAGQYSWKDVLACLRLQIPNITVLGSHIVPAFHIFTEEGERRTGIGFNSLNAYIEFEPDSVLLQTMLGFTSPSVFPTESSTYRNLFGDMGQKDPSMVIRERCMKRDPYGGPTTDGTRFRVISQKPVNMFIGKQMLFLYSDVCDYSYVGDSNAQLLRVVTIKGQLSSR